MDRVGSGNTMTQAAAIRLAVTNAFRSPFVQRFYTRAFLPVVFSIIAFAQLIGGLTSGWLGLDAEIYYRGSAAWLAGLNPWDTFSIIEDSGKRFHYSALPPMTIIGAPFTVLPEPVFVMLVTALSGLAAVYIVRRLKMPLYWLLFPPMVEGVLSGNPSIILLALLLSANPLAEALAPLLKVYAFIPLFSEQRWRGCWLAVAGFGLTFLLAWPLWMAYLSDLASRSGRLMNEADGGFSTGGNIALFLMAAVSIVWLILIDRKAAGWLIVPALWPASQFHYSTLAMPVMHPILALGLALPHIGVPSLVITAYVLWRVLERRMADRSRSKDAARETA